MDYASLREEAVRVLEQIAKAGGRWTDFNEHDPGITILEQVCYALTDLSYRTGYSIPDLLATGGGNPYESLYPPAEILSSCAVTLLDLRKAALDVDGVRNVWITPFIPLVPLGGPVPLKGLHRVLIDISTEDPQERARIQQAVADRLHENRNVGEDFAVICALKPQLIQVQAVVEIGPVDDAKRVRSRILQAIDECISPAIRFATAEQWWNEGIPVDEIFDGPLLDQRFSGERFIDSKALEGAERRTTIYTAKLIRVISDVPGVRAVTGILVSSGETPSTDWILDLDSSRCPRLDWKGSAITLRRDGIDTGPTNEPGREGPPAAGQAGGRDPFAPPPSRDRNTGNYHSVQNQFPALYGIGETGLPDGAPPARRAQAKQLKAYLLFFDQPMANYLAQLAHLRNLLSFNATPQTYFEQPVDEPSVRLDALPPGAPPRAPNPPSPERRNGFLDHLLARFAEQLTEFRLMPDGTTNKAAEDKTAFLKKYPRISSARGTGLDVFKPLGKDNLSGLEERIALKLGLDAHSGEKLVLVEHILLRHVPRTNLGPLILPDVSDPYSLQVTFVVPDLPDEPPGKVRFANLEFRRLLMQTLRDETPAHLIAYIQWLSPAEWTQFETNYASWLEARRKLGPFDPDGVLRAPSGGAPGA